MKITHYTYNAFLIESGNKKIAIDPGGKFLYFFSLATLIPKAEWRGITHIFVTHGDPDHYWHVDRVAKVSNAPIICHEAMLDDVFGQARMLSPRRSGITFEMIPNDVYPIAVDQTIDLDGMTISGIKTMHGELLLKFGPLMKKFTPGPNERIGWGSIGFNINLDGVSLVNLGDTLLLAEQWKSIERPDVLMIPIGGSAIHNTMDEDEALKAVSVMKPKIVIPCHYNCPALFTNRYNPADAEYFKTAAEKLGAKCVLLGNGGSLQVDPSYVHPYHANRSPSQSVAP